MAVANRRLFAIALGTQRASYAAKMHMLYLEESSGMPRHAFEIVIQG